MREFLHRFADGRHLSLTLLSIQLGYSSPTSLFRLMNGHVRPKTLLDFRQRMETSFSLTPKEKDELYYAVDKTLEGDDFARQSQAIHHFVNATSPSVHSLKIFLPDGSSVSLLGLPGDTKNWHICLLNACYPSVISIFQPLVSQGAQLDHYLYQPLTVEQTMILLPILFHKHYSIQYLFKPAPLNGLNAADLALISNNQQKGFLIFHDVNHASLCWEPFPFEVNASLYRPAKTVTKQCSHLEDYPDFCRYCASLEEENAVYMIKPDLHYGSISGNLLKRVLLDHSKNKDPAFSQIVAELTDIFNVRFQKTFTRHQHTWLVMNYDAMLRFVRTGRLSDHFIGFSPFSIGERKEILVFILEQMRKNPYIHYHFLKNEKAAPAFEIDLYEKKGLLIQNQHTNYDLSNGVAEEIMIDSPAAIRQWKEYYLKTLVEKDCWNIQKSCEMMEKLIQRCTEQT